MAVKCDHCYGKGYLKCKTCGGSGKISESKRFMRSFIRYPKTMFIVLVIILILLLKYWLK